MQNSLYNYDLISLKAYNQEKSKHFKEENLNWFYLKSEFPLFEQSQYPYNPYPLSDIEKELERKMEDLRNEYRVKSENSTEKFITAVPFYEIKNTIETSDLYKKVFKDMPKGSLLHVHSAAALSIEGFYELLKKWGETYPTRPTFEESDPKSIYVLKQNYKDKYIKGTLLYKYTISTYPDIKSSLEPISTYIDSQTKWDEQKALLTFTSRVESIKYIWTELNNMFSRIDVLFSNREFYKDYHKRFLIECYTDKIEYIEMRCGFASFTEPDELTDGNAARMPAMVHPDYSYARHFYYKDMLTVTDYDEPEFLDVLLEALEAAKTELQISSGLNLKIILNVRRDLDPLKPAESQKILERLDYAIKYHRSTEERFIKYNNFVIGFDFVSEEDKGRATAEYYDFIYGSNSQHHGSRISLIDFYLHDGESLWPSNTNMLDACLISKYRVGHGFNLAKNVEILNSISFIQTETYYKKKSQSFYPILEVCPISNQLLRYFPDLRCHSAYELMKRGVQCVIANDDPFMFQNPGLSYDFWMAYVGFNLNFQAVKRLVYNSILPWNYEARGKNEAFDEKWDAFVRTALSNLNKS